MATNRPVGLIATTKRSGSRWIYRAFKDVYGDLIDPAHEPHDLREFDTAKPRVGIGWTIGSLLAQLNELYGPLSVVHLTRNPKDAVLSHLRQYGTGKLDEAFIHWYEIHTDLLRHEEAWHGPWVRCQIEKLWADPYGLPFLAGFLRLPKREALLEKYHQVQIGKSTAAVTTPAFTLPHEIHELAKVFGYIEDPHQPSVRWPHVKEPAPTP